MHEQALGAVVDRFGDRHQRCAVAFQLGADDRLLPAVAEEAGQLVHHGDVDVALLGDAGQHLLKCLRLVISVPDRPGSTYWPTISNAELDALLDTGVALSWQRDALGVVVGINLPGG